MNLRDTLSAVLLLLGALAMLALGAVFVRSLSANDRQEDEAWVECDLAMLAPGATQPCGHALVYRRTEADKRAIGKYVHLLDDPQSLRSEQPASARNLWRSANPEYFVFVAQAPVRECPVRLRPPGGEAGRHAAWPEATAIQELPYFDEPCTDNRMWDTSGRLYRRANHPPERNLTVPDLRWTSLTQVTVKHAH